MATAPPIPAASSSKANRTNSPIDKALNRNETTCLILSAIVY
jgi:hypothetical protein